MRYALRGRHRQRLELARLEVRQRHDDIVERERHLPAEQRDQGRCVPVV
jgi:hypothetical protein